MWLFSSVPEFHPNLIGLTGNPDEIKKAARAYRVYYMKTAEEDSDYLVDHSIVMYVYEIFIHKLHTSKETKKENKKLKESFA